MPPGRVEQVASKVVPSVVMLETDLGRQSEEGSGIILSADGLILTNNHVVAAAAAPPKGPGAAAAPAPKTTVTFSDGRTAPFTVVGADPTSDIAVVRVQGVSGLTPISPGLLVGPAGRPAGGGDRLAAGPGGHGHHRNRQRAEPAGVHDR